LLYSIPIDLSAGDGRQITLQHHSAPNLSGASF
jgi:hypothetical protein